jgi:hypothetical protein
MEEIVTRLKEKAGLTDEQALKSIEIMKDFILGKVPPMFSGFVDNFFADGGSSAAESDSYLP